jgi:cytochrome c oxidase accessory protein FixG
MNHPLPPPERTSRFDVTALASLTRLPFHRIRHWAFVAIALFTLAVPFIQINGNQLLMMSFLHMEFHLLGIVYDMQELYLIPLVLILFFVGIFLLTALGGRVWCGWGCPQTMFRALYRDLIQGKLLGLRKWHIKNRPLKLTKPQDKVKFVLGVLLLTPLMLLASANLLWFFVSPYEFIDLLLHEPGEHSILLGFWLGFAGFFLIDITWIAERFCRYACPYARIQTVLFDADTPVAIYDRQRGDNADGSRGAKNSNKERDSSGDCTGCEACVRVCPAGIDIRQGLQLACVSCLECVDACEPVMARVNKANLVHWASEKTLSGKRIQWFRPRVLIYLAVMLAIAVFLVYRGQNRETLLLNVNRTTELYSIKDDGQRVENHYVILITNIDSEPHEFALEVTDLPGVAITRPKEPFRILPDSRVRKVVIVSTDQMLVNDPDRNTSLPMHIRAYALDGPEQIQTLKPTVFMFPPSGEVRMPQPQ